MEILTNATPPVTHELHRVTIESTKPANVLPLLFILIHVPLALQMDKYEQLSTAHAYVVLAIGIIAAVARRLDIAAAAAAYIAGAEVLWRMTHADVFWEFGKYATVAIFVVGLIRSGIRNSVLPFVYFGLLIPSTILTAEGLSVALARSEISFNLSGPLALLVSTCFFSGLSFTRKQMGNIFISMLAPITGILSIAAYSTLTATAIHWSGESNWTTSGGFGPNQVSSMLGLGALITMLCFVAMKSTKFLKFVLIGLGIVLITQALLTFSRGGVYLAASTILVATFFLVRQPRQLIRLLFGAVVVSIVMFAFVRPWLNSFTGDRLEERYKNVGTTGRKEIIEDDLRIWSEHPFLGVGPGQAMDYRRLFERGAIAHTEFTRLLAEHGMFGLAAIGILIAIAFRNMHQTPSGVGRAVNASLIFWSISFMAIYAMRLAAPAFLFGLSSAFTVEDDDYAIAEAEVDEENSE